MLGVLTKESGKRGVDLMGCLLGLSTSYKVGVTGSVLPVKKKVMSHVQRLIVNTQTAVEPKAPDKARHLAVRPLTALSDASSWSLPST